MFSSTGIRQNMDVVTACGTLLGVVDRVEGQSIKLARCGPKSSEQQFWIPFGWIDTVDASVNLNKNLVETIKAATPSLSRPILERRSSDAKKRRLQEREKANRF